MRRKNFVSSFLFYIFLIGYGIGIIFLAYRLNLWEDESYSMHTSSNNLIDVIRLSYDFEGQPPFYFVILSIWRHINPGIFFARLLSTISIGISAFYFYRLVRLVSGADSSRWMIVIFLLNPFSVWAALEIRLYSLAILLSTILVYYFFLFFIRNKKKYLYLFLFFALIGIYTQYFFTLEIFAFAISMLIFKGWKDFFKFCAYLIPVAVLFIPNLFMISTQVEMIQELKKTKWEMIVDVLHAPQRLMFGQGMAPINNTVTKIVRILLIAAWMHSYFLLYKKQKVLSPELYRKINITLTVSIIVYLLYVAIVPIMNLGFEPRYTAILFPLFILLLVIFKEYNLWSRNLIFCGIASYYAVLLFMIYKTPIKRYDFKTASDYVNTIERQTEPIVLYSKVLLPPFSYYYHGRNKLMSLSPVKYDENYYNQAIIDTSEFKSALNEIYSPTKSYLLITGNIEGFRHAIKMDQQMFDNFIKSNYTILSDTMVIGNPEKFTLRVRRIEVRGK